MLRGRRVVPRSRLEAAAQRGVGLAYACFWLPAWGDCCLEDPACSPVGQMRLVPDITGGWAGGGGRWVVAGLAAPAAAPAAGGWSGCGRWAAHASERLHCAAGLAACPWPSLPTPSCRSAAPRSSAAAHTLPWMPSHATALVTMCREPPHTPWECCPRSGGSRRGAGCWQAVCSGPQLATGACPPAHSPWPALLAPTSRLVCAPPAPPPTTTAALRRVLAAAHADHGLSLQLGFELEFYLLRAPKQVGGQARELSMPGAKAWC